MYEKYKPLVTLTAKGSALDLDNFDVKTEVREKAAIYWEEKASKNKNKDKLFLKDIKKCYLKKEIGKRKSKR